MICVKEKTSQSFFVYHIRSKEKNTANELFKEMVVWKIEKKKKTKGNLLTAFATIIKKDPQSR